MNNKSGKETPIRTVNGGQQVNTNAYKFVTLCTKYKVTPTKRQFSKFNRKKGILYKLSGGK